MKSIITILSLLAFSQVSAAELTHQFNSPAFSGQGYSSHILTIKQLEDQAKDKNKSAEEALKAKAEAEAANTPQARFIANLESRIYSQLAKQLTDSMFGEGATCTSTTQCGVIPDIGGNMVSWHLSSSANNDPITGKPEPNGMVAIDIKNLTDSTQHTVMYVPVGTFYF